jgi:hypothetical protein
MQLNQKTLQNYELEPPPAFPLNSPHEGVNNIITHYSSQKQASSSNEPNVESTTINEENLFVGQR